MKNKIIIYMVLRNVESKKRLFYEVFKQASKISKDFFVVNHGSTDGTEEIIQELSIKNNTNTQLITTTFEGTMDEMKGKYFQSIKQNAKDARTFLMVVDWDEVLDNDLITEIKSLDFSSDIYLIQINTYLINQVIDKNHFQPRLFEINSVEISNFSTFHNLFKLISSNTKKLKGVIHHYSYSDMQELIRKNIFYAQGEAKDLYKKDISLSNTTIFFKFIYEGTIYFLYTLLYHRNFLTLEGWLYSTNWYVYKYYKYLFYLELKNKHSKG